MYNQMLSLTPMNLRKEVGDLAYWIGLPCRPSTSSLSQYPWLLRRNEFLFKHSHSDPKESEVNGLFISQLTFVENAWGKAELSVGRTSKGKGVFSFGRFTGSPAGDLWNRFLKFFFPNSCCPRKRPRHGGWPIYSSGCWGWTFDPKYTNPAWYIM